MIFVGVVGNKNSGKSSIIQSVTGCKSPIYNDFIYDNSTNESIYVCCHSPQELIFNYSGSVNIEAIEELVENLKSKKNCRGLIMALQPNNPRIKPSIEDVYNVVTRNASGFSSFYCFVVEPGYINSPSIINDVGQRLSSVGLTQPPIPISGEEFPFKSATKINNTSSLIC